jgi:TolA-binding protein
MTLFSTPVALALAALVIAAPIAAGQAAVSTRSPAAERSRAAQASRLASGRLVVDDGFQQSDSLYRAAVTAMNDGEYTRAATLFQRVADRYPDSPRASQALYYRAYSLFKAGGSRNLSSALSTLEILRAEYGTAYNRLDGSTLRIEVCGVLARQGDERCASEVVRRADPERTPESRTTPASSCPKEGDDNDDRIAALNALLQMNAEMALPVLEKVLARRDDCWTLRKQALFLVSQKRNDRAVDMLVNAARNDPHAEVREQAIFWLGQTNSERAVDILSEILERSGDVELQKKAVFALTQTRSTRGRQIIRDVATRDNAPREVRADAIFWLGQGRSDDNGQFLRTLYGRLRDDELKDKVIFSLSQQRSAENQRWLMDLALNEREDVEMRKKALFWAGQQGGVTTADLARLYDGMRDREMKDQVIFVLSQRSRDGDAVDKLMSIVKDDCDAELRKKALFWLGQSRDPRSTRFIEDIVLNPPRRTRC